MCKFSVFRAYECINISPIINAENFAQKYGFYLDVDGIKYVVNYDYPHSSEDYIHRIGRTGRCDSRGTSYAFFTPSNSKHAKDLISVLEEAKQVRLKVIYENMCYF